MLGILVLTSVIVMVIAGYLPKILRRARLSDVIDGQIISIAQAILIACAIIMMAAAIAAFLMLYVGGLLFSFGRP